MIHWLTWISRYAVWIGGAGIIASAVLVTIEVIIRKFFGMSMAGADEVSGYLFAIGTVWAMPFALLRRANVRIDVLYAVLPRGIRVVLDFVALILLATFVAVVFWHGSKMFIDSVENWTRSITPMQTPQAIPQVFWIAGLGLFLITALVLLAAAFAALLRGDLATIGRLIGARTQEEELVEEISSLDLPSVADDQNGDPTDGKDR